MLSNGPGDPADNTSIIEQLSLLELQKIPTFGICLGHQLLALSQGAKTRKLKYGHRGANQPAKDLITGRSYMTSQNHGFAVDAETLPANATLRFINGNDGTCEGLGLQGHARLLGAVPSGSLRRSPGHALLVRPLYEMMGGNHQCR